MRPQQVVIALAVLLAICRADDGTQDKPDIRPRADLRGSRGAIKDIVFHPDGRLLFSAGADGRIRVWELESRRCVREIYPRERVVADELKRPPTARSIESIAVSPDGRLIAEATVESSAATALRIWNPEDGEPVRVLAQNVENLRCVAIAPDGKLAALNARDPAKGGHKIVLQDLDSGQVVAELRGEQLAASLLTFSRDGKLLASAGANKIHIWDVPERKLLHTISEAHKKSVKGICFSPDGKWLASGSSDATVRIWKVATGTKDREIETEQQAVLDVAWSPSGKTIATAGQDKTIKFWKPQTGKMYARLWGHSDRVTCVEFSPDGKTLASGSDDATIALWDVKEPQEEKEDKEKDKGWWDD